MHQSFQAKSHQRLLMFKSHFIDIRLELKHVYRNFVKLFSTILWWILIHQQHMYMFFILFHQLFLWSSRLIDVVRLPLKIISYIPKNESWNRRWNFLNKQLPTFFRNEGKKFIKVPSDDCGSLNSCVTSVGIIHRSIGCKLIGLLWHLN